MYAAQAGGAAQKAGEAKDAAAQKAGETKVCNAKNSLLNLFVQSAGWSEESYLIKVM